MALYHIYMNIRNNDGTLPHLLIYMLKVLWCFITFTCMFKVVSLKQKHIYIYIFIVQSIDGTYHIHMYAHGFDGTLSHLHILCSKHLVLYHIFITCLEMLWKYQHLIRDQCSDTHGLVYKDAKPV